MREWLRWLRDVRPALVAPFVNGYDETDRKRKESVRSKTMTKALRESACYRDGGHEYDCGVCVGCGHREGL
jgi:hypothetical protein